MKDTTVYSKPLPFNKIQLTDYQTYDNLATE
jgi:hypothetical protein